MADQFYLNIVPATATPLWLCWRLVNAMIDAGYVVVASGNGAAFGVDTTNRWSTYAGLGTGSWICLKHPGFNFEIVFWRNGVNTSTSKVIVGKQLAFSTAAFPSASATSPGTIPATAGYFRGDAANWASWFGGGTSVPGGHAHIAVKDVASADQGAWYVIAGTPAYGVGSAGHSAKFSALDPAAPLMGSDFEPYAFQCHMVSNNDHGAYYLALSNEYNYDGLVGTSGSWWGYRYDGTWAQFGGDQRRAYLSGTTIYDLSTYAQTDPYSGGKYFLDKVLLSKIQTGVQERKGFVRSFRVGASSIPQFATLDANVWVKFSTDVGWIAFNDGVSTVFTFA